MVARRLARLRISQEEFAPRVGAKGRATISAVVKGTNRIRPERIDEWARALELNSEDAKRFRHAVEMEWATEYVRAYVRSLERQVRRCQAQRHSDT
jgi:hypothetical protein